MAKSWSEVVASEGFQSLSDLDKNKARQAYFDEVVAPNVPAEEYETVWREFDADSQRIMSEFMPAMPAVSKPEEQPGLLGNTGRRIIDRSSDLVGNFAKGVGKVAERGQEALTNLTGMNPGIVWGDGQGIRFVKNMPEETFELSDALKQGGEDVRDKTGGYVPDYTWEQLKQSEGYGDFLENLAGYVVEQGGGSIPDMVGVLASLPVYVGTRTEEIATDRAQNDMREDGNSTDYAVALPTSIGVAVLERIGAKGVLGEAQVQGAKQLLKETGKAATKEAGTEFVQEGAESAATTTGTETGFGVAQTFDQALAGAVAGGGMGAGGRFVTGTAELAGLKGGSEAKQAEAEAQAYEQKMAEIAESLVADQEQTLNERPQIEDQSIIYGEGPKHDVEAQPYESKRTVNTGELVTKPINEVDNRLTPEEAAAQADQQYQDALAQIKSQSELSTDGTYSPNDGAMPGNFGVTPPQQQEAEVAFDEEFDAVEAEGDAVSGFDAIEDLAEIAGMSGVPSESIQAALSLDDEGQIADTLEQLIEDAQGESILPEAEQANNGITDTGTTSADNGAREESPQTNRAEPENGQNPAGLGIGRESGSPANSQEAEVEAGFGTEVLEAKPKTVQPTEPVQQNGTAQENEQAATPNQTEQSKSEPNTASAFSSPEATNDSELSKAKAKPLTVKSNDVEISIPSIGKETENNYNRSTHIGRGRDFNAELKSEAESILNELEEKKHTLDTPEQKIKATELIESYLEAQADFIKWQSSQSVSNPSWAVTGRGNRDMNKYNKRNERHMDKFTEKVDALSRQRKRIRDTLYSMRPDNVKSDQATTKDLREAAGLAGELNVQVERGQKELAKDTRKWASPKFEKLVSRSLEVDSKKTIKSVNAMNDALNGKLVEVLGPRSKAAKLVRELIDGEQNRAAKVRENAKARKNQEPVKNESPEKTEAKPENKAESQATVKQSEPTVEGHKALFDDIIENPANHTPESLKANFENLLENKEAVIAELRKMTKKQLSNYASGFLTSSDKKARYVSSAWDGLITRFAYFKEGMFSYGMGSKNDSIRKRLNELTQDDIQAYSERVQAKRNEFKAEMQARVDHVKKSKENPETLKEFKTFIEMKGEDALTDDQREQYDALVANKTVEQMREEKRKKAERNAIVEGEQGDIEFELHETKHTKKGHDLFVVSLKGERLPRDKFDELHTKAKAIASARRVYSSYSRDGAIPGFQFTTAEQRDQFVKVLQGEAVDRTEQIQERQEQKEDKRLTRLEDLADRMEKAGEESMGADRKTNTARRASMAAHAEAAAASKIEFARLLRNIAELTRQGEVELLSNISSRVQLKEVLSIRNQLLYANGVSESNLTYTTPNGNRAWKAETTLAQKLKFVKAPKMTVNDSAMMDVVKLMRSTPGYKLTANALEKLVNAPRRDHLIDLQELDQKHFNKLAKFVRDSKEYVTERVHDAILRYQRLEALGVTTEETARQVLRELDKAEQNVDSVKIDPLKQKERELVGKFKDNDFHNTPDSLADELVELADIEPGMKVLEPSAGSGHIAEAIARSGIEKSDVDTVEMASELREILELKGYKPEMGSFLDYAPDTEYDRIVMNPPFSKGQDMEHVRHAYDLLKPGGKLVAVVSSMAGERQNSKDKAFKEWFEELDGYEQEVEAGTFKQSINATGVNTKILVLEKPEVKQSKNGTEDSKTKESEGLSAQKVGEIVSKLSKKLPGLYRVVQSVDDLPDKYKPKRKAKTAFNSARGFYDPSTNEVYLIADNIRSEEEAEMTYLHEVVGHFGMKLVFGDQLNEYLDRVYKQVGAKKLAPIASRYGLNLDKKSERRVAVEEYIAHTAELNGRKPHWFKRLVARVRDWLRSLGLVKDFTDNDIYSLISMSHNETVDSMIAASRNFLESMAAQVSEQETDTDSDVKYSLNGPHVVEGALAELYAVGYSGETIYPLHHAATKFDTLLRHYGYEGNIGRTESTLMAKTPGTERADLTIKRADTGKPYAVIFPTQTSASGIALYQAAMDWTHNNNKVLVPDPSGLTNVNRLRRTEAMLASYGRTGTTRHVEPDWSQFMGFLDESDYQQMETKGETPAIKEKLERIKAERWADPALAADPEAADRANYHNMAVASLALTLRRKPELLNYRINPNGDLYEISSDVHAKPKRIAKGAVATISEIKKLISPNNASLGVGTRTAIRAVLAQTALGWDTKPKSVSGAVSASLQTMARTDKGQVVQMPERAVLPARVISRLSKTFSEGPKDSLIYYSKSEKDASVMDIISQTDRGILQAFKNGTLDKAISGGRSQSLGLLTLRQLADVSQKTLPHIKAYLDTVHKMVTRRNQLADVSVDHANDLQQWARKNQKEADEMFDLMHESTLANVDPSENFVERKKEIQVRIKVLMEQIRSRNADANVNKHAEIKELKEQLSYEPTRMKKHADLEKRFNQLSPKAKRLFRETRDKYRQQHQAFYDAMKTRIEMADISDQDRRAMLAELRWQHESTVKAGAYFPLSRFGDWWVETVDEDGERVFTTYESEAEQKKVVSKLEDKGVEVTFGKLLDTDPEMQGASLSFVKEVMDKIDESGMGYERRDQLKDVVYQLYLQAMPSRSIRKHMIHRKGIAGFHNDAIRAFAENMTKGSYQLARLEHQDALADMMVEMEKTAKKGGNRAGEYYNEMKRRHEWVMNPTHSAISQKLTGIGFVWLLGITPAAALVNTTQNFVVALPVLASKFGWKQSAKMLMETSGEFLASAGQSISDRAQNKDDKANWSIRNLLKDDSEQLAYDELVDMGVIDVSQAHNLAGIAETDSVNYSNTQHKVMSAVSYLFHKAEVYNRETTAMSAYRLARKKGMNHGKAVDYAANVVWDSHFDYSNINRARFMQGNFQKVMFQFKQYSQNISYYLLRNLYKIVKSDHFSPEERKVAATQLGGTLAVTGAFGGLTAMPLIGIANFIANALLDDDEDEPFDAETEIKQWIVDQFGDTLGERILWGVGGAGISGRITLDGLWVRRPNRDLAGQDLWSHYAQQFVGPTLGGIAVKGIRGIQTMEEGDIWKGAEMMVPKAFADISKMFRYGSEGALTRQGYTLKDDFNLGELFMQGIGVANHDLMKRYDANSAIRNYERKLLDRRAKLVTMFYVAYQKQDKAAQREALELMEAFSKKNPELAITARSLKTSIRNRLRNIATSEDGMRSNNTIRKFSDRITFGD